MTGWENSPCNNSRFQEQNNLFSLSLSLLSMSIKPSREKTEGPDFAHPRVGRVESSPVSCPHPSKIWNRRGGREEEWKISPTFRLGTQISPPLSQRPPLNSYFLISRTYGPASRPIYEALYHPVPSAACQRLNIRTLFPTCIARTRTRFLSIPSFAFHPRWGWIWNSSESPPINQRQIETSCLAVQFVRASCEPSIIPGRWNLSVIATSNRSPHIGCVTAINSSPGISSSFLSSKFPLVNEDETGTTW